MLTPEMMLTGYARGIFPMAESRDSDELHWVDPRRRGIFPLDKFHISRSLAREIRRGNYEIRTNFAFSDVVRHCAERDETWINRRLRGLYDALHARGHAHTMEVWRGGALTGGVFGVTLGAAFFGESMFSNRPDASKIALAFLIDRLTRAGFTLFDVQFLTPHLASLGATEIPRLAYHARLAEALEHVADFGGVDVPDAHSLLQRMSQTS